MNTNGTWVKGMTSPNPEGRRKMKHSARTVKGMVERFIHKNVTPNKLQKMFDALPERDRLQMLLELLPYCASKQPAMNFERLTDQDLDRLYNQVMSGLSQPSNSIIHLNPSANGSGQEEKD